MEDVRTQYLTFNITKLPGAKIKYSYLRRAASTLSATEEQKFNY